MCLQGHSPLRFKAVIDSLEALEDQMDSKGFALVSETVLELITRLQVISSKTVTAKAASVHLLAYIVLQGCT